MKNQTRIISNYNKKIRKVNIPLRRRIATYYTRLLLLIKISSIIFLFFLLFTNKLNFIKQEVATTLIEAGGDLGLRLERVIIDGQQNIEINDITTALNADTGTPMFAIDIKKVKKQLEQNSWVRDAVVERRLPNTIYIGILEKKPIAIWQLNKQLYLIDNEGYIIYTNKISTFSSLLHIVGAGANIHAKQLIYKISSEPSLASQIVSAVRYGERRWNLLLRKNITVKMPETDFDKAWKYLVQMFKSGKLFKENYKTLDLRDRNKYYVEYYK